MSDEKKNNQGKKENKTIYPVRETHIYNGNDIPSIKLLDLKCDNLLERMRIYEYTLQKMQHCIYSIDEDYQLAKHEKKIACMCCPFLCKSKQRGNSQ
ncbi:MAG: hypothetical protein A2017_10485 [Lentisphaerae bacterium GWF2_44_16]|nr:MAG: hypothetical protein A2017_10485 [Lentisphaerae bacterium GWF2_44_16]